jgi:hypothetical protein
MQNDDTYFWSNTENYSDVGIHNRLEATNYQALAVTYKLVLLPSEPGGAEEDVAGVAGDCTFVAAETEDGVTRYIYRATWESALTDGREYAIDFRCDSIKFGKRLKKTAQHY